MPKQSAGLLLFRRQPSLEVLLVHPGGPFWKKKDAGAWSIPKGEYEDQEDPFAAALREFQEEVGPPPAGPFIPLGQVRQSGGKIVTVWAAEGDLDPASIHSNTFKIELPRGSGRMVEFPEIDRAAWFSIENAREKLIPAQTAFLDRLANQLDDPSSNRL